MGTRDVARKPLTQSYQLVLLEGAYGPQDLLDDGSITALFYLVKARPCMALVAAYSSFRALLSAAYQPNFA